MSESQTQQPTTIDITILMPCLNEAQSLPSCIDSAKEALKTLEDLNLSGEILISDNGSTDGSIETAERLGCRVTHCKERGYGAALRHGCEQALGQFIIMGDSDASYDFREGLAMVEKLQEGYDLCVGNRFTGKIHPGAMPWKNKYIGNPILSGILNLFFRTGMRDAHSGLRGIRKEAFLGLKLRSPGMEFASEMLVKATLKEFKCTEVPISLHPDKRGRPPHLNPWRDGLRHLYFLAMLSPIWAYFVPSLLIFLFSSFLFIGGLTTPATELFQIGPFAFGDHWMILAGGLFSVSISGLLLGYLSLLFSLREGYRLPNKKTDRLKNLFSIQNIFIFAALFIFLGIAVFLYVFVVWASRDFTNLDKTREMVLTTAFLGIGIKLTFWGVIFSLIKEKNN